MSRQTEILLQQTKANSWPNLSIGLSRKLRSSGIEGYSISISNRGTGPAIIEGVIITYNDKPVHNWSHFYETIEVPDTMSTGHSNDILNDEVVPANYSFMVIDWSDNKSLMEYIFERADKIAIEVCYKSVHEDYWRVKRTGFRTNLERNERSLVENCTLEEEWLFLE